MILSATTVAEIDISRSEGATAHGGMHRMTGATGAMQDRPEDGWHVTVTGTDPARERWAETVTALANGTLGVRGVLDERASHGAATLLATVYETSPIHYHERHKGFAAATDTRVPVADAATIAITVDGTPVARVGDVPLACERRLDLRTGRSTRRTVWPAPAGPIVVTAERVVPPGGAVALTRYSVAPASGAARIVVTSGLQAPPLATEQGHDPRIGTANLRPLDVVAIDSAARTLVQRTHRSGIVIAAAAAHRPAPEPPVANAEGFAQRYAATVSADAPLTFVKAVAYADTADAAQRAAAAACEAAAFDQPSGSLDGFWADADIAIEGDPDAERALRFNMFHVFQSCPRDGRVGLAAKGLTGEGYEGHSFWDGEIFVLPMLAVTAPALARAMLDYRYATLDAARDNARALDHARGALFAWRTIAGHEASAHYPSGSAQYHINADVAFAIGLYDAATGDMGFLIEQGGEMLAETARIWFQVGHFAADGTFHIFGVTGPDEYTVLIDDNWYTNRMAQAHLRLAADIADRLAREAPEAWGETARRIGLCGDEIAVWRRAADAMRLPYDSTRDIDAQDSSFLDKPEWDIAGTPADRFPLLLHHHPMTLYRHQVAKQADLVLGMVLAGDGIDQDRKRRAFDHYARVTVHDSTLSDASFAILAAEVGRLDAAMRHFRAAAFVDLHDLHRNTDHGAHMAAMGGSWQALVWGFGGFRPVGTRPRFAPVMPAAWDGYRFTMLWRGTRLGVAVARGAVTYRHLGGPPLDVIHRDATFTLTAGERRFEEAA